MQFASFSRQFLYNIGILVLVVFCNRISLKVRDEIKKYAQGKTTSSTYMEVNPGGLQLPSVTLCPGFKQGVFDEVTSFKYPHLLKMRLRNKTVLATEAEIRDWFQSRTYNLDEGILYIKYIN